MIVSDTAVKNRISVLVLAAIIVLVGIFSYNTLPRESSPDIPIPYVFVSTPYKGVSSADIESAITLPIEKKLKGLDQVKKISSSSSEGLSQINIEFLPGTDIDVVLQKVRDKVDEAQRDLPTDLETDPIVFEVNISEMPIIVFTLSGTCGVNCLKDIAEDLKDRIEGIKGILEVEVTGGREREIRVEVDPDKLAYYRIPLPLLQQIIGGENQNTSGGSITLGDGRYQVRVPGEFESPDELYSLVVSSYRGQPVYLKDVARVVDGFKDETGRARLNGKDAVSIAVKKRIGENVLEITDAIGELIEQAQPGWPEDTVITKLMDQSKDIRMMISDLENNIITGLLLVVIVLFFALGIRNAILVGLAIPFSMLLSFAILKVLDITLNMVVLFSLTLALGMLVDNAIVIIENVYRYMQQGVGRIEAAMRATSEVAYPVIGSTLTTLAAFMPLMFWPGIMGEFMKYLPITLVVTLSSSLFVAMVINPALAAIFIKVRSDGMDDAPKSAAEIEEAGEKPAEVKGVLMKSYTAFLSRALNHRFVVICISFAFLVLIIQVWLIYVGLEKPVEFFPHSDPPSIYINIEPPEGADLEYIDRMVRKIEMAVSGINPDQLTSDAVPLDRYGEAYIPRVHQKANGDRFWGPGDLDNIKYVYAKAVEVFSRTTFGDSMPNHVAVEFLDLEDRKKPVSFTLEKIRERIKYISGGRITIARREEGPPTGAPVNIEISGEDFSLLGELAKQVRVIIAKVPSLEDIQDDYVEAIPSIRINIDRQKAALLGLSTQSIAYALKMAYRGVDVSTYREGDDDFDITVTLAEKDRQVTDVLRELMIPTPTGQLVPLTTLASIDYSGSLGDIMRVNHNRVVTVKANVDEDKMPGPVARQQAAELLKDFAMPPGYEIRFTGEFEFQQEAEAFLTKAFSMALFLIFLILVTLFNSVTQPLIIMTSVILSLGGAFLGLFMIDAPFGIIMSGVGVISLAGIVVNNAIVLIDYTNKLRSRGMELREAVISAGATRLRPVLLTAITTILGLLPMLTGVSYDFQNMRISWVSESSQFWQQMAAVVIFGLMVATFLTLVVVPSLYSLLISLNLGSKSIFSWIKRLYWKPFADVS